ncbi:hypothetical protein B296_00047762 [Ensete ventricosum]|uniref:Uncharacterized protein n=1 Tax=Ensete ventricosum TaxID=4639 RepID=A0A426YXW3_ENSVE|nr:hypothetical protein B296_00047762 [Ensete ventricosum]
MEAAIDAGCYNWGDSKMVQLLMERKEMNLLTMCSGRAMQKSMPATAVTLSCAGEVEGRNMTHNKEGRRQRGWSLGSLDLRGLVLIEEKISTNS